jgi:hypothetical protein
MLIDRADGVSTLMYKLSLLCVMAAVVLNGVAAVAASKGIGPDTYEPDNMPDQAVWIGVDGGSQAHNFHESGDEDWLFFYTPGGETIMVETFNLGANCDTFLEIFNPDGQAPPRASDDNSGVNGGSLLSETFDEEGFYRIRVTHATGGFGVDTEYSVRVFRENSVTPADIFGVIRSVTTGDALAGALVEVDDFGGLFAESGSGGFYSLTALPPGTYTLVVSLLGFEAKVRNVTVQSGSIALVDIDLRPDSLANEDVDANGVINAVDVQLAILGALGLPTPRNTEPDVNRDGRIDAIDVQMVIIAVLNN